MPSYAGGQDRSWQLWTSGRIDGVRWAALFDDLEAQAELLDQAARAAEVAERARGELGAVRLVDRARAAPDAQLRVRLVGAGALSGRLLRVGPDWWLVAEDAGREAVLATAHLTSVRGLGRYAAVPGSEGLVESRLTLRHALRGIVRDRSATRVHLVDGTTVDGTLDRIGADLVEVAAHPAGEPRRAREVRDVELVPLVAIVAVRRTV